MLSWSVQRETRTNYSNYIGSREYISAAFLRKTIPPERLRRSLTVQNKSYFVLAKFSKATPTLCWCRLATFAEHKEVRHL